MNIQKHHLLGQFTLKLCDNILSILTYRHFFITTIKVGQLDPSYPLLYI